VDDGDLGLKIPRPKLTEWDISIAIAQKFDSRRNYVVPNVFWGLGLNYEIDVLVVSPAGIAREVEIKTSRANLKADGKKQEKSIYGKFNQGPHRDKRVRYVYFALPDYLRDSWEFVPDFAGILEIDARTMKCTEARPAKKRNNYRWSKDEIFKLLRLGTMRIWPLRRSLNAICRGRK